MDDVTRQENEHFENEVLRIARALWPSAAYAGATKIDGKETDGVFVTEDCIHVVEATTSRRKEKAKQDMTKIAKNIRLFAARDRTRAIRGWFVTRDEPTADQRNLKIGRDNCINILSFAQFQSKLVDSFEYLSARANYAFGSVRDPETGDILPQIDYVPLDIVRLGSSDLVRHKELAKLVADNAIVVLTGDYGAGKSMTLREVYQQLRREHVRGRSSQFPVYLNLRDHYGQDDPSEILSRHARSIGFVPEHHLVRAWRAGYVHLLIDGFDEIAGISIQGEWRRLQRNRYEAMTAVRRFITEHPRLAGLLVAGRAHFFDSRKERITALGLPHEGVELSLNEFTVEQVQIYLKRSGLSGTVPSWLPSRPLLVGYLAAKGHLADIVSNTEDLQEPSLGKQWHVLLDAVASREAAIETGIDGSTVRRILERLATKARGSQGGLGSLSPNAIVQAFSEVCGHQPSDRNMVLLQRLPGLGVDRQEEDTRAFVDETFADACRAGDTVHFIEDPFSFPKDALVSIDTSMLDVGINVALHRSKSAGYSVKKINAALSVAGESNAQYVASDIVRMSMLAEITVTSGIIVGGVLVPRLEIQGEGDLSRVVFQDCFFSMVEMDAGVDDSNLPSFRSCYIDGLDGRVSDDDLPKGKFDDKCIIERFVGTADTTADVLMLDLPLGARVCISILKKVYEQRGAGRRENALFRGMDHQARRLVPDVLRVLQSEGLLVPDRSRTITIWRGAGACRTRAGQIIAAPNKMADPALQRCNSL